jgi:hypothetical protein
MFILSLIFLAVEAQSHADIYNRQILPLGETEAFMANTGTGGAPDTGAIYYNPAALTRITHSKMAVTGSTYLSFKINADSLVRLDTPPQDIPYQASGFNTIPASYVIAHNFESWSGAISILVPDSLQLENRTNFTTTNTKGLIVQSTKYSELWVGGTFAKNIDSEWSVGGTLFGVQYSNSNFIETEVDIPTAVNTMVVSTTRYAFSTFGFSLNMGILYEPSKVLSLGLRLQTPLLNVSNHADSLVNTRTITNGVITSVDEDRPNGLARYQLPLDTTLGAKFRATDHWNLYTDLSFQVATHYSQLVDSTIDSGIKTDPTFRYSVGTELTQIEKFPIRLGFYYNPSALHDFENNGKSQTKIDYIGVTGGLSYLGAQSESSFGIFYISGSGKTTITGAPGDEAKYTANGVGGMLSSSYRF